MSVVGIGTDIVDISRIVAMTEPVQQRLAKRVLTPKEFELYRQKGANAIAFLAKRWAAKEAASKALGTGIAAGVSFQHIDIEADEFGKPILNFTAQALAVANSLQASHFHVSISDEANYAVAFVVLSR